mmetsp:Transcript_45367/g.125907  ORF Transcript_45367/g.125907 Transcript_45367/m.125907 type:complete len:616 (+) Transcript_45367:1-1848(+)
MAAENAVLENEDGPPENVVVLENENEHREPSEEEVCEYADYLGIDLKNEPHLRWIACEGVVAPVPPPWKACSLNGDDVFFFNFDTQESLWDHPCDEKYRRMTVEYRQKYNEEMAAKQAGTILSTAGTHGKKPAQGVLEVGTEHKLEIKIIKATGLAHLNLSGDAPWCLCEARRPGHKDVAASCKTQTCNRTLDPVWNMTHELCWWVGEPLEFTIYDKGLLGNKTEGRVSVPAEKFYPGGFEGDIPIAGLPHAFLTVCIMPEGVAGCAEQGANRADATSHGAMRDLQAFEVDTNRILGACETILEEAAEEVEVDDEDEASKAGIDVSVDAGAPLGARALPTPEEDDLVSSPAPRTAATAEELDGAEVSQAGVHPEQTAKAGPEEVRRQDAEEPVPAPRRLLMAQPGIKLVGTRYSAEDVLMRKEARLERKKSDADGCQREIAPTSASGVGKPVLVAETGPPPLLSQATAVAPPEASEPAGSPHGTSERSLVGFGPDGHSDENGKHDSHAAEPEGEVARYAPAPMPTVLAAERQVVAEVKPADLERRRAALEPLVGATQQNEAGGKAYRPDKKEQDDSMSRWRRAQSQVRSLTRSLAALRSIREKQQQYLQLLRAEM